MTITKILTDVGQFLVKVFRNYGELIIGIFLGVYLGKYFDIQNGLIVAAIGSLIYSSRIIISDWYRIEFSDISTIYKFKTKISKNEDTDFIREAIQSEQKLTNKLQELSNGILNYNNIGDYIKASIREVQKTNNYIKATALINLDDWEEHGELGSYLKEQFRAIEDRHIDITRIFFLTKEEEKDQKVMNILKKQFDKGIKVYTTRRDIHDNSILPFAICDEKVALIGVHLDENRKITHGCKTVNKAQIEKLNSQFDNIFHTKSKLFEPTVPQTTTPQSATPKSEPLESRPSKPKSLNFEPLASEPSTYERL